MNTPTLNTAEHEDWAGLITTAVEEAKSDYLQLIVRDLAEMLPKEDKVIVWRLLQSGIKGKLLLAATATAESPKPVRKVNTTSPIKKRK